MNLERESHAEAGGEEVAGIIVRNDFLVRDVLGESSVEGPVADRAEEFKRHGSTHAEGHETESRIGNADTVELVGDEVREIDRERVSQRTVL